MIRRTTHSSGAAFSFRDIEAEAHRILESAKAEAAQLIADARRKARHDASQVREAQERDGFEQGRAQGLSAGRKEAERTALDAARQRLDTLAEALAEVTNQLETGKHRLLAIAENGVIDLAVAIARRVCKTDVARGGDVARRNVRHVLEQCADAHDPVVHLHPSNLESLQDAMPGLTEQLSGLRHVKLVADESVEPGGCILRTRDGKLDGALRTQLDRIAADLVATPEDEP